MSFRNGRNFAFLSNFHYLLKFLLFYMVIFHKTVSNEKINNNDLQDNHLRFFSELGETSHLRSSVEGILIPRVVGTEGHTKVREFIVNSMKDLNWQIELDTFDDVTPNMGKKRFTNIITTLNSNADRYLVLACHYDSKHFAEFEFLGATDSAVPCAMLLNLAHSLNTVLKSNSQPTDVSLMFVFFDGEEAFHEWSPLDSIYGARHLSNKWNSNGFIKKIDMLVLLDLIGAPDPKFYSFFRNTDHWHAQMVYIEERLSSGGFLENYTTSGVMKSLPNRYFQPRSVNTYIEDDHTPFLKLKVPVIHLIPVPFPDVWHTLADNDTIIDYTTVENINKILRVFLIEYLQIDFLT